MMTGQAVWPSVEFIWLHDSPENDATFNREELLCRVI